MGFRAQKLDRSLAGLTISAPVGRVSPGRLAVGRVAEGVTEITQALSLRRTARITGFTAKENVAGLAPVKDGFSRVGQVGFGNVGLRRLTKKDAKGSTSCKMTEKLVRTG